MIKLKQSKQISKVEESSQDIHDLIEPNICVNEDNSKSLKIMDDIENELLLFVIKDLNKDKVKLSDFLKLVCSEVKNEKNR